MLKKIIPIFLFLLISGSVEAESKKNPVKKSPAKSEVASDLAEYEALKVRYLKIRNTDRNITREADWQALVEEFLDFYKGNKQSAYAAGALYNAAMLQEQIFRVKDEDEFLDESIKNLKELARVFPSSELADDALVKAGDLTKDDLKEAEEAQALYQEVVKKYPRSDMYDVAKIKAAAQSEGDSNQKKVEDEVSVNPRNVIMLDPGHGGEDFGAVGVGGLLEKDVTLDVAFELKNILETENHYTVRVTRQKDEFVPLMDRTSLANDFDAIAFISLHANASPSKSVAGVETYYLDNTGDKSSKTLADRENASVKYEGEEADLRYMLSDLIQNIKLDDSIRLAGAVQSQLISSVQQTGYAVRSIGVKKAPFYVLVGAHMPCILVEMGFIDNAEEGVRLGEKKTRHAIASGIAKGLKLFLSNSKNVQ